MSNSGSGAASFHSGRNYGLSNGDEPRTMSSTDNAKVQANVARLRELGVTVEQVWSPAETLGDTRYLLRRNGNVHTLLNRDVAQVIADLERAERADNG